MKPVKKYMHNAYRLTTFWILVDYFLYIFVNTCCILFFHNFFICFAYVCYTCWILFGDCLNIFCILLEYVLDTFWTLFEYFLDTF